MIDDHSQYLLNTYARPPLLFTHGRGCKIYATSPTSPSSTSSSSSSSTPSNRVEYLDFTAGIAVNALGHGDPQIAQLMADQASRLVHSSNVCWNEYAGQLAQLLVTQTRDHHGLGLTREGKTGAKVFFTNSGTESNEGALKFARLVGKNRQSSSSSSSGEKTSLVCFSNAFHGRSLGALSVTPNPKYQLPFSPLIPNVRVGQLGDIDSLSTLITDEVCGVIVEPIQGEGGLNEASKEWFVALAKRAREVGAVLIYDEIQVRQRGGDESGSKALHGLMDNGSTCSTTFSAGCTERGPCGRIAISPLKHSESRERIRASKRFAHTPGLSRCRPDIVTMAKPLANGFPIGAILVRDEIAEQVGVGESRRLPVTFPSSVVDARGPTLCRHARDDIRWTTFGHPDRTSRHLSSLVSRFLVHHA